MHQTTMHLPFVFTFNKSYFSLALSQLAVAAEHIHNLVDVHLLHVLACRLQILTWVEVARMLSQMLTDGSSHGETRVGVDVDLANCAA